MLIIYVVKACAIGFNDYVFKPTINLQIMSLLC